MLELKTKWFTNSLAKESILKSDFVTCENGTRLYIVGFGNLTSSGKNTYNYELKDEKGVILASGENVYLDKLTTIIKGTNPKAKANKEGKDAKDVKKVKASKANEASKDDESFLLTFDEAFNIACKQIEAYKVVAIELDKYDSQDTIKLAMIILQDAKIKEAQRVKNEEKSEALQALKKTLEIARASANEDLIKSIEAMIRDKENE